jgi:hypothetical protein
MQVKLVENKTRKVTTKIELKMKDGSSIPAGTTGTIRPVLPNELTSSIETTAPLLQKRPYTTMAAFHPEGGERDYRIKMSNLPKYFKGFTIPSWKTIEKWEFDQSMCKTPVGTKVEPDGWDPDGWPSWMLILGII